LILILPKQLQNRPTWLESLEKLRDLFNVRRTEASLADEKPKGWPLITKRISIQPPDSLSLTVKTKAKRCNEGPACYRFKASYRDSVGILKPGRRAHVNGTQSAYKVDKAKKNPREFVPGGHSKSQRGYTLPRYDPDRADKIQKSARKPAKPRFAGFDVFPPPGLVRRLPPIPTFW
jgi:hypothetical protein